MAREQTDQDARRKTAAPKQQACAQTALLAFIRTLAREAARADHLAGQTPQEAPATD